MNPQNPCLPQEVSKDHYIGRRQLDITKRIKELHYRRERLERELKALKIVLITLNEQMQREAKYEQLSI